MSAVITIVGRPNVGKSTLFNTLTESRDALVADLPGLTRDRQYGDLIINEIAATLVDTGGMLGEEGALTELMDEQIMQAVEEADLLLFVVSAKDGLVGDDHEILNRIRPYGKPIWLLVNKSESKDPEMVLADFYQLGIEHLHAISTAHRRGITELKNHLAEFLKKQNKQSPTPADYGPAVAVIGRPNVGKSTLVNRLLGENRVLAYDLPGTTRDSIHLPLVWEDAHYTLIDTAGVRRKSKVGEGVEKFSIIKTIDAIKQAQVCLLLIDATENITDQDLHLIGLAVYHAKPVLLVINKWDHLTDHHKEQVKSRLNHKLQAFQWLPMVFTSALHGSGLRHVMERVALLLERANMVLTANQLTNVLIEAYKAHQPPLVQGLSSQLKYAHPGGHHPMRIIIHGKRVNKLPDSYKRYLENTFRDAFDLKGIPLVLQFKAGRNPFANKNTKKSEFPSRRKTNKR
ncbi:MAG: ribosome biogenesis GTPase Der [Proteobacteria bacterium]|nr:MAG: ribosome biogenesis GTPase Der [Pseudomonadota bacterium]